MISASPLAGIDIRALRIFLTLVNERSVTRTSLAAGVSQPAITQALNRLRQAFGDPLLVRGPSGMQPTERALMLEREVRRFLDAVDALHATREDFDPAQEQREFVVTAPEYLEMLLLPPIARRLRREAPGVTLRVRPPHQLHIGDLLASGEVDLRLGWVLDPQPSMRALPLFEDDIVVIGGPDADPVPNLDLETYIGMGHIRLLGSGRTSSGRAIDEFIRQQGADLRICVYAQGLPAMLDSLLDSDMVATIPRKMAMKIRQTHPVWIADFPGRLPAVRNGAYWHERTHRSSAHRWLRKLVAEAAAAVAAI